MPETQIIQFVEYLLEFDKNSAIDFIKDRASSDDFLTFFSDLITKSLEKIGKMWERGLVSLSQVYMSGKICEELVNYFFKDRDFRNNSTLRIAAVTYEDHHTLGKLIVKSILRSVGYEIDDLGSGKGYEEIVKVLNDKHYDVLLVSTLMLDAALGVGKLKEKLKEEGIKTKIVVGGAPFNLNRELWKKVDADYAVVGNLNGVEMIDWSRDTAEEKVKEIIRKAARGRGLAIADNHGEIPYFVSKETLLAIREAVDRWGRYPISI